MKRNYIKVLFFTAFMITVFCLSTSAMESENKEEKLIKANENIEKNKNKECYFIRTEDGYRLFNYDSKKYNPEIMIYSSEFNRDYNIFIPLIEEKGLSSKNFENLRLRVECIKGEVKGILGEINLILRIFNLTSKIYNDYWDNGPETCYAYEIKKIKNEPKNILKENLLKIVDDMKDLFSGLGEHSLIDVGDILKKVNEKIGDINRKIFDFFNEFVGKKILIKDQNKIEEESEEESD